MNNSSLNINNVDGNSYVCIGIDKITLGIESRYLNYQQSPFWLSHIVDIVHFGNWSKLHIQLETNGMSNINPYYPFKSVIYALQLCINNNFFNVILANSLNLIINGIISGCCHPYSLFIHFFDSGIFTLDEYELYFDFYEYNPLHFNRNDFKYFKKTYYTKDYRKMTRTNGFSKGVQDSILCFYDRGQKIGVSERINRLEFRLHKKRAKGLLNLYDLFLPVPLFIDTHCDQIRHILKRYIPEGSINIDEYYLLKNAPELFKMIDF